MSNNLNQYPSAGGTTYTYDASGNLSDDNTYLKYYFDCENPLTDVNNQSDEPVASYKYDYQGRRVRKIIHGDPCVITQYCYDGDQVILEYNGSGSVVRCMYYGAGTDEPIVTAVTGSGSFYFRYDGLGRVAALSEGAGNIKERYTYDVFGRSSIYDANRDETSQSFCGNLYMFTGRRYDGETGLYYYRARCYNPEISRPM